MPKELPKRIEDMTIVISTNSDGEYQYDIHIATPEEVVENQDAEDGGVCTSTFTNAIDMACDQAKELVARIIAQA